MRILISGAAGFIGSHLTDRFLADGHAVIGVDNFSTGLARNLDHLKANPDFRFIYHDVIQPVPADVLQDALDGHALDWVMHFASPASPPKFDSMPVETLRVNAEGTYHLLELARRSGAKFFFASTSECYGDPLVHPQREDYWGNVNSIGPRAVYDEGKRYAEAMTTCYNRAFGVSTRLIRIFNTYGPRMDPYDGRIVTNFINQILRNESLTVYGSGSQTRSFQFVDDLVEGIVRLMTVEYFKPVNLGNPEEFTVLQFANLINELMGGHHEIVFKDLPQDDPQRRRPDISRAQELLGWEPKICVREGLATTIQYFKALHENEIL